VPAGDDDRGAEVDIDLDVAFPTRISAFAHGADAHFGVDRAAADRIYGSLPEGVDALRIVGDLAHAFLERGVRYLAGEAAIDQFLVFGSLVAGRANVHQLAREIRPEAKVAYVLFDPVMLVYAHRLVHDSPPGTTAYFTSDLSDVDDVVRQAGATLDLSRPVAVIMPAVLGYVLSGDRVGQIIDGLAAPLATGSHLMATLHASDLLPERTGPVYKAMNELAAEGKGFAISPRTHDEVAKSFSALDLVDPGVVPIEHWRPEQPEPGRLPPVRAPLYGAVARKPSRRR
jgi:hypothetical protein